MYDYQDFKPELFKEENQAAFLKIRDGIKATITIAGCISMDNAIGFANGEAANIVLNELKYEHHYKHTEQDMKDCFNAGVNRGVTVAAIITGRDIGEEFPRYDEYMEKFKDEE